MSQTPHSLHALLAQSIDYAGLYPPASLDLPTTLGHFLTYAGSAHHALLARLIVPATKLEQFAELAQTHPTPPSAYRGLSVLIGSDADIDIVHHWRHETYTIAALEAKAATVDAIRNLAKRLPQGTETFVELPLGGDTPALVQALADTGLHAKIRTGGETADKFPSPEDVAAFIHLCATAHVKFKATAGLHHPIRATYRLTYAPDSPTGVMHGFLNVFMAAAFAQDGWNSNQLTAILSEEDARAFRFDATRAAWRDHTLNLETILATRQKLLASFGSCSFVEPVADLRTLHLLMD